MATHADPTVSGGAAARREEDIPSLDDDGGVTAAGGAAAAKDGEGGIPDISELELNEGEDEVGVGSKGLRGPRGGRDGGAVRKEGRKD